MELQKRKQEDDGGSNVRRPRPREEGGAVKGAVPKDEEVEEFFAILKRAHVAVKYFQQRHGRRCADREMTAAATRWSPIFQREDFDGVKTEAESSQSQGNQSVGLDLNSYPVCDDSDHDG